MSAITNVELFREYSLWKYVKQYLLSPPTPLAVDQLDAIEMDLQYSKIIRTIIKEPFSHFDVCAC